MQTKDYTITLDMLRTLPFRPFEVVEGDTGNVLHITLLNNGDPMDISECNVCIAFASSAGFAMQDETSGIEKTAETGTFDVSLLPTAYGAGNVSADVQIYSGTDRASLITSTRFDFRCRKSLIDGETVRASSAYPPLVEAARIATEAAASALAAAARIDTDLGELNVQADWAETDAASDAFILNKPAIPAVPSDIGAAAENHASRHAAGGADAVSPASILAAGKSVIFDATLPAADWGADCLNLCDEVWEQGYRSTTTGADGTDATTITQTVKTTNDIPVTAGSTYSVRNSLSATMYMLWFNGSTFISNTTISSSSGGHATAPTGATALKLNIYVAAGVTPSDVRWSMVNAGSTALDWEPQGRGIHLKAADYSALAAITGATAVEVIAPLSENITDDEIEALQAANLFDGTQVGATEIVLHARGEVPDVDLPVRILVRGDLYE